MLAAIGPGWEIASIVAQICIGVLQIGLLAAAIWLARETGGLRHQTGKQVELLLEQLRAADRPLLLITGVGMATLSDPPRGLVTNLGPGIAYDVDYWWYDSHNRNLATTETAMTFLKNDDEASFVADSGERYAPEQAIVLITQTFESGPAPLLQELIQHRNTDYALVVYRSKERRVYAGLRRLPARSSNGNYDTLYRQREFEIA